MAATAAGSRCYLEISWTRENRVRLLALGAPAGRSAGPATVTARRRPDPAARAWAAVQPEAAAVTLGAAAPGTPCLTLAAAGCWRGRVGPPGPQAGTQAQWSSFHWPVAVSPSLPLAPMGPCPVRVIVGRCQSRCSSGILTRCTRSGYLVHNGTSLVHTGTYRYIPVQDLLNGTCMYVLVCTKYVLETLHVSLT